MIAIGAILAYAITATATGFSIHKIGIIAIVVGIIAFAVGLLFVFAGNRQKSVLREDIRNVPGGTSRVVERDDNLP